MTYLIKIHKSTRKLDIFEDGNCIASYPIGIGKNPEGNKEREGDHKTPEGVYHVICKNPNSKYHLSLGLDYPNPADAKRGLENGVINDADYQAIIDAHANGDPIPWKTPLGGEIFIHGAFEEGDGSEGCIRLFKADIEALFEIISIGTRVAIVDN